MTWTFAAATPLWACSNRTQCSRRPLLDKPPSQQTETHRDRNQLAFYFYMTHDIVTRGQTSRGDGDMYDATDIFSFGWIIELLNNKAVRPCQFWITHEMEDDKPLLCMGKPCSSPFLFLPPVVELWWRWGSRRWEIVEELPAAWWSALLWPDQPEK